MLRSRWSTLWKPRTKSLWAFDSQAQEREVVAYHEAGHTLVAWSLALADPVVKVTIILRGCTLGVTEMVPSDDRYSLKRNDLLARRAVLLGGRASEELVFGDVTVGAENDLVEVTRLARRMMTRWGMGSLGWLAFRGDEAQPFLGYELSRGRDYGDATADRIDADVLALVQNRRELVNELLEQNRARLDSLAQALLVHETLEHQQIEEILGARPSSSTPI